MQLETNQIIGSWYHISFTVYDFVVDVGQVFSICCDCVFFLDETNTCWLACSSDLITCNFFSSFIASYSFQSTWLVRNLPFKIEFLSIGTFLVGTAITGLFLVELLNSKRLTVQEQFNTCNIRVSANWNLSLCIFYFRGQVSILPVPVRKKVYHRFLLSRNPLALVEIKVMFWNTCCIYDTKVRALNGSLVLVVPWCRFTDIVRTCPDKLSSIASVVTVKCP